MTATNTHERQNPFLAAPAMEAGAGSQKLCRRKSHALASTFSRIAGSGSRRAISVAPIIVEKMAKKARSLSVVRLLGHKGDHSVLVADELGKDLSLHFLAGPRHFGGKRRQGAAALDVVAVIQGQVGLYDRLPWSLGVGLFGSAREFVGDVAEGFAQRLQEQIVLAVEVLVEASVGQAGVAHDRCDRGAGQAFGAYAMRGIFHDLSMDFGFVFRRVAHGSL